MSHPRPMTRTQGNKTVLTVGLHNSEEIGSKTKCLKCITKESLRAKLQLLIPNKDIKIHLKASLDVKAFWLNCQLNYIKRN